MKLALAHSLQNPPSPFGTYSEAMRTRALMEALSV
jgi:hypothetical protein